MWKPLLLDNTIKPAQNTTFHYNDLLSTFHAVDAVLEIRTIFSDSDCSSQQSIPNGIIRL